jgi:signal transduction histidine kinase
MTKTKRVDTVLSSNFESILKEWRDEVRLKIPKSNNLSESELNDGLKMFFRKIIEILSCPKCEQDSSFNSEESMAGSKLHGKHRSLSSDYSISDFLLEYRIFRFICIKTLKDEEVESIDRDMENLVSLIDNGIVFGVISFLLHREFKKEEIQEILLKESFGVEKVLSRINQKIKDLEVERNIREQFVLTLTHDLRNPLSAIKASAELIILKSSEQEGSALFCKNVASRIVEYINRSDRMIKDLLDASKIRADGAISLRLAYFSLDRMILDTIRSKKSIFGDRFTIESNPIVNVNWDEDAIRRVFENLITNAVKHGSEKDIKIGVVLNDNIATVYVNNQGELIPDNEIDSLFLMFKQFKNENDKIKKGWGLGLTLVKGITEAHGGKIRVENSLDKGVTFFLDIPLDPSLKYS